MERENDRKRERGGGVEVEGGRKITSQIPRPFNREQNQTELIL